MDVNELRVLKDWQICLGLPRPFYTKERFKMDNELKIKRAYEYMLNVHQNEPTGHDVAHIERVYNCALYIAQQEGIDNTLVIELVALLHDTVDYKLTDSQLVLKKFKHFSLL